MNAIVLMMMRRYDGHTREQAGVLRETVRSLQLEEQKLVKTYINTQTHSHSLSLMPQHVMYKDINIYIYSWSTNNP